MSVKDQPAVAATLAAFPGAEIVDVRQAPPDDAGAGPKPPAGYSLAALAVTARTEAARIAETQQALRMAGDRNSLHAGEMERSRQFEAMARLCERIAGNAALLKALQGGGS